MAAMGLLAIFVDVDPARDPLFRRWHSREHLAERVAHPGFRRGMRFRNSADPHRYALLYEADDVDAFSTPEYERSLREPTTLSIQAVPAFARTSRTICEVQRRYGSGVGNSLVTATLGDVHPEARGALVTAFQELATAAEADESVLRIDLVAGRHDIGRSVTPTSRLRQGRDDAIGSAVLVHLAQRSLASRVEACLGSIAAATIETFDLVHLLSESDL